MTNPDDDKSLGDQNTFAGGGQQDLDAKSLGDEATFAGGVGGESKSLGDEVTFGGDSGSDADVFDVDMEIVDLELRYKIESVLGKGGMGEVLLATDTRLNRKVAIKRIFGDAARSRTAVNRFLTEAQSIATLNHPNIVQIYDYGRAADGPFLIMEYVDGGSLLDRCREGALPLEEAVDLTCQLCDGLSKAHAAGIVHRDIKPANVLITGDGVPKLTDFGLAKDETADTGMTMAGAVLGTLDFMPPEQRRDAALTDNRSDLWSLAATLYQMVTGRSPKIIKFNDVPKTLHDVLGKALEDSKDDRYQTALALKDALIHALQGGAEDYAELDQGECPHCGTKNDATRKFCRNADCGGSIEASCLSCSASIPMWEAVCGSCGSKQAGLLEERRERMSSQRQEAEECLVTQDYNRAIELARELGDEPDLRLQQLKGWSETFVANVQKEKDRELTHVAELFSEALKHEEAFDDPAGIKTLNLVPGPLRQEALPGKDDNVANLLSRLTTRQKKATDLGKRIQARIKARQFDGLQPLVDDLLKIRPHRTDVTKLKQQLIDRRDKLQNVREDSYAQAIEQFEQQDYHGCLTTLAKINASLVDSEVETLRERAEAANSRAGELDAQIRNALSAKQYDGLLEIVEEYLFLQKDDTEREQLKEQLVARGKKQAEQVTEQVAKARKQRNQCDFDSALQTLSAIPQSSLTGEAQQLSHDCTDLQFHRSQAISALKRVSQDQTYGKAWQAALAYHSRLEQDASLQDNEFTPLYQQCQTNLKAQQQRAEAAERVKAVTKKMVIFGGIAATAVVLLIISVLGYSSWRASKLADAVNGARWDEALNLDAENVPALVGRAKQKLVGVQPDLEAIAGDLAHAEKLEPSFKGLPVVKGQLYAAQAAQAAEAGKIDVAESKLRDAERLNVASTYTDRAKQALAVAYAKRAESAVAEGNITQGIADGERASFLYPGIGLSATLAIWRAENRASDLVRSYEQDPNDSSRDLVIAALDALTKLDKASTVLTDLRQTVSSILESRCQSSLSQQDYAEFASNYGALSIVAPLAAKRFESAVHKLPASILATLPASALQTRNSIGMELRLLPAGTFTMGDDRHAHQVTLTRPFYIGTTEVTQDQFERIMGIKPWGEIKGGKGAAASCVSWQDAFEFCKKLSQQEGKWYRLPTEAEWEFACRANNTTAYSFGDSPDALSDYAWFEGNAVKKGKNYAQTVGVKKPNEFGLHDMHGNVWEWCQDWYDPAWYESSPTRDPIGPPTGNQRVIRGGSFYHTASICRSAQRMGHSPTNNYRYYTIGFRVVMEIPNDR